MKTVIINRAVPGSGKTTMTKCIIKELEKHSITYAIHSTDEYFMVGNRYMFDITKLNQYHQYNLDEFIKSLKKEIEVVICDNTNIAPWQSEPYSNAARKYNYQILCITLSPRELEKHIQSQQITPEKPDAHGVSEEILKRMIDEYYRFDDLLNPRTVIDKDKHMHYEWDEKLLQKVAIGVAKHFDIDYLIRILPNEYHEYQQKIGKQVLSLVKGNI